MHFSAAKLIAQLPLPATPKWKDGVWDIEAFKQGEGHRESNSAVSAILYQPHGTDHQTSHDQDELYFIVRGSGVLTIEGVAHPFEQGDALFVAKGQLHRFTDYSEGLTTWAVFF